MNCGVQWPQLPTSLDGVVPVTNKSGQFDDYAEQFDEEFGLCMDPCEHPSANGGICAACGADVRAKGPHHPDCVNDEDEHGRCLTGNGEYVDRDVLDAF